VFQAGALHLSSILAGQQLTGGMPLLVKISDVRFRNPVYPGDTVTIEVRMKRTMGAFYVMSGHDEARRRADPERGVFGRLDEPGAAP
jgi:3-hydroxyacyl-[acyl-carrier-protein] dehydratase